MLPLAAVGMGMAAVSAVGSISQASQQKANAKAQKKWDDYNAQMSYNTALINIDTQANIDQMNIMALNAATDMNVSVIRDTTAFNANMIRATTAFNNSLMENELDYMWDAVGLDLELLERERAVERGTLEASQAVSGVVMGQDSAAIVLIDQRTQEQLDAFVIRHGADIQAAKIANAMAENIWQGEMEARRTEFEGSMSILSAKTNTALQASTILTQGNLSAAASKLSARHGLTAETAAAKSSYAARKTEANNTLVSGLFNSAAMAASAYYGAKVPNTGTTTAASTSISAPDPGKFQLSF